MSKLKNAKAQPRPSRLELPCCTTALRAETVRFAICRKPEEGRRCFKHRRLPRNDPVPHVLKPGCLDLLLVPQTAASSDRVSACRISSEEACGVESAMVVVVVRGTCMTTCLLHGSSWLV